MPTESDIEYLDAAVEAALLTPGHADEILGLLEAYEKMAMDATAREVAVKRGFLTDDQALAVARRTGTKVAIEGYDLLEKLGSGGMGAVWHARQKGLDRDVALKILPPGIAGDPEFVQRFITEARAVAQLDHENIVQGIDVGESAGYFYFAMEYLDGPSVKELVEHGGPLPEKKALEIAEGVARGLAHAHAAGIIHRDVKPDNIVLTGSGQPKLADLGLAKRTEDASITVPGVTMGTPYYMSPEQAEGQRDIDGRSDIYSLGATLFFMLTGSPPFEGKTPAEVMSKHLEEQIDPVKDLRRDVSPGASRLVAWLMEKKREERPRSAEEVVTEIERILAGAPAVGHVKRPRRRKSAMRTAPAHRSSSGPVIVATITAAVVALIALAFWAPLSTHKPDMPSFDGAPGTGPQAEPSEASPLEPTAPEPAAPGPAVPEPAVRGDPLASTDGLLFYAPFDTDANAAAARGAKRAGVDRSEIVPDGRRGGCVRIQEGGCVQYARQGNMELEAGTLMLWVKAARPRSLWHADDSRSLFLCGSGSNRFVLFAASRRLIFQPKRSDGKARHYEMGKGVIGPWQDTDWHHVAMSWRARDENGVAVFYADGRELRRTQTAMPAQLHPTMKLGRYENLRRFDGSVDELYIHDRVLEPEEVAAAARLESTPVRRWQRVFNLFDEDGLDFDGSWRVKDGTIVRSEDLGPEDRGPESRGAMQSRREFADGEVEIVFRIEEGDFIHFGVRQGPGGHCRAIFQGEEAGHLVGRWHSLVFTMERDEVTAALDGAPKDLERSGGPRTGRIQIGGGSSAGFAIREIRYRPPGD